MKRSFCPHNSSGSFVTSSSFSSPTTSLPVASSLEDEDDDDALDDDCPADGLSSPATEPSSASGADRGFFARGAAATTRPTELAGRPKANNAT